MVLPLCGLAMGAAPMALPRASVTPCGLLAGGRCPCCLAAGERRPLRASHGKLPLRPGRGWPPLLVALATCGRPYRGLRSSWSSLQVLGRGRSPPFRAAFTIRMKRMKEVKHLPLKRYPHDGSLH
ncbi:hypothetical protein B296_00058943 [Ensete ventricosum]|uniref:Uncharacterized protein n=1 Tax=Ensete ventricosum TaxID=4639 RepID=A0A426XDV8_ENSVE|nr:hypothetical protein B296_00058943 [Ensete ventricosum]